MCYPCYLSSKSLYRVAGSISVYTAKLLEQLEEYDIQKRHWLQGEAGVLPWALAVLAGGLRRLSAGCCEVSPIAPQVCITACWLLQFTVGWYEVGGGDKLKCQLKLRIIIFIMTKIGKNRLKWTAKSIHLYSLSISYMLNS